MRSVERGVIVLENASRLRVSLQSVSAFKFPKQDMSHGDTTGRHAALEDGNNTYSSAAYGRKARGLPAQ
jgi:hypothetical protein